MSAALTTNVDQRLLRTTKFPPEFNVKVDMEKVNLDVIKTWAQTEISKILNSDDDVVAELVSNVLQGSRFPNIKELQISLTGFLDKDAPPFCQQLWKLCLSAQDSPSKVPKELIEAKKAELAQEKVEEEKAREEAQRREDAEKQRERDMARIRERERDARTRGRGDRGFRGGDRRSPRDSRSPPRRRRDDDDYYRAPPRADTYVPSNYGRRRPSPSYTRGSSRSRSPPPRRRRRESSPARSPPPRRKRRNTSSERSSSPDRHRTSAKRRRDSEARPRSRSPRRTRRSRSPRRDRVEKHPQRNRSRSPPQKRNRKASPSPNRLSRSGSSSSEDSRPRKKGPELAPDDLMANKRQKERPDSLRLSRQSTSRSRSNTPLTDDRNHRESTETFQNGSVAAAAGAEGEEEEESFSFKGAAKRALKPVKPVGASTSTIAQQLDVALRKRLLKEQVMAKLAPLRAARRGGGEPGQSQM